MASKRSSGRTDDKTTARKGGTASASAKGSAAGRTGGGTKKGSAGPKPGPKAAPKASTRRGDVDAPAALRPGKGPSAGAAKKSSAVKSPGKSPGKSRAKDKLTPAAPKARRPPPGKGRGDRPAGAVAVEAPVTGKAGSEPTAALPQRRSASGSRPAGNSQPSDEKNIPPVDGVVDAQASAGSDAPDPPSDADAPLAERTTEDLWVLYRTEAHRLRAELATLETEEELDEEQEFLRLEAEERANRELRARETAEEGESSPEAVEAANPAESTARSSERPGQANSPWLELLRNELIERHYPLVRYIAERLLQTLPKSIELDDLVSAGQFGLMDAIRGFDPNRGIKFKTYCSTRIRGSILDQLRSQDWVPRLVRLKASRIDKALQRLTGEFGREPTHAELARALELEHGDLAREMIDSQAKTMFSLSEKWDDDDDGSVEKVEILEDRQAIDPVHELNRRDLMGFITRSLTHKERFIIEQYYQYGHTMREIGEMLTLTESRVCQIHSNVMGRLKNLLAQRDNSLES
jgi:RNA polymerase sigma factor FliA